MTTSEARRLKELEDENATPRKLVANQTIEIDAMKEMWQKIDNASSETICCSGVYDP